jgi:hypothetical protein
MEMFNSLKALNGFRLHTGDGWFHEPFDKHVNKSTPSLSIPTLQVIVIVLLVSTVVPPGMTTSSWRLI